jgi:hypothetical protein
MGRGKIANFSNSEETAPEINTRRRQESDVRYQESDNCNDVSDI